MCAVAREANLIIHPCMSMQMAIRGTGKSERCIARTTGISKFLCRRRNFLNSKYYPIFISGDFLRQISALLFNIRLHTLLVVNLIMYVPLQPYLRTLWWMHLVIAWLVICEMTSSALQIRDEVAEW